MSSCRLLVCVAHLLSATASQSPFTPVTAYYFDEKCRRMEILRQHLCTVVTHAPSLGLADELERRTNN